MSAEQSLVDFEANLALVRDRIEAACKACGREPSSVRVLAASKTRGEELLRRAYSAGVDALGENYVQELVTKSAALADLDLNWHFIGHLQRNKVKQIVGRVARIHSIDSRRLAFEVSRRAAELGRVLPVCIEVHIGGEESKGGFEPDALRAEFATISALPGLAVDGLMTLPPFRDKPEDVRPFFAKLRSLRDELSAEHEHPLPELSMGMSADLEAAVLEGATWVRVGTALFGPRARRR